MKTKLASTELSNFHVFQTGEIAIPCGFPQVPVTTRSSLWKRIKEFFTPDWNQTYSNF